MNRLVVISIVTWLFTGVAGAQQTPTPTQMPAGTIEEEESQEGGLGVEKVEADARKSRKKGYLLSFVDMHEYALGFVNTRTNAHANVDLRKLPGWPAAAPLHTLLMANAKKVYVTYMGSATEPAGIVVIKIGKLNWTNHTADVTVVKDLRIAAPGAATASFPNVTQVTPNQPTNADWNRSAFTQVHAPQLLPKSKWAYFSIWTDNRVVALDTNSDTLAPMQSFGERSRQIHGVHFNPEGTLGLTAGYFYDKGVTSMYRPNSSNGQLTFVSDIKLGSATNYAAYSHTVVWLDNRYAIMGTMQHDKTSLTPAGQSIVGPSVWLIDTQGARADQIIASTNQIDGAGVLRSASYVAVAQNKLFVAEEDSLDASFADDGFVSVFDIKDWRKPVFLKRFKPGAELPADFSIAHSFSVTPDDQTVFLESWHSGYIVKIDVPSLTVTHIDGDGPGHSHDGEPNEHGDELVMPHGSWIAGGH